MRRVGIGMKSFALCGALALLTQACALETAQFDGSEPGEASQELTTWSLPFASGSATGVSPVPPVRTEVVDGILGWAGTWYELPLVGGWQQTVVFRTSTLGGSKTGMADLRWSTLTLPADGTYRIGIGAPIRVRGFTKVKVKGNALTGIDAKSEASLYVYVTVGTRTALSDGILLGRDETKSEERSKHFDKTYDLTDPLVFEGKAGERVSLLVRVQSKVWANSDGSAELAIKQFGIPAVTEDNVVWVEP
jgi:hypothetical protein